MKCIYCGGNTIVKMCRTYQGSGIRQRQCKDCRRDYYTQEVTMDYDQGRTYVNAARYEQYKRVVHASRGVPE